MDPLLGPLQHNGGCTFTMALLPGSLAINNGQNQYDLAYDQRGPLFLRTVNGRPDIGAYELQDCSTQSCPPGPPGPSGTSGSSGGSGASSLLDPFDPFDLPGPPEPPGHPPLSDSAEAGEFDSGPIAPSVESLDSNFTNEELRSDSSNKTGGGCSVLDRGSQSNNNLWLIFFLGIVALRNLMTRQKT
jgi:hypothetical protein